VTSPPPHERAILAEHDTQRARHLWILEFGSRSEFNDPRLAYRRLFAEVLGTFMLVLVAAGGGVLHAKGQISLSAAVVAPGLMVMAIILFMGAVSGAHLNPVVSIAFALRGDFPWRRVPGYLGVQLLGATLALSFSSRKVPKHDVAIAGRQKRADAVFELLRGRAHAEPADVERRFHVGQRVGTDLRSEHRDAFDRLSPSRSAGNLRGPR